jgi:hypothetical protein
MKIRAVTHNNRQKAFEVRTAGRIFWFPYAKADPRPAAADPVIRVLVDKELGRRVLPIRCGRAAKGRFT